MTIMQFSNSWKSDLALVSKSVMACITLGSAGINQFLSPEPRQDSQNPPQSNTIQSMRTTRSRESHLPSCHKPSGKSPT